jgi:Rrf2 family protein
MLMLDLAVNNTGELVKIKDISDRQSISEKYLEQIISTLKKAGYVKSLRGALGGYRLAKDPKEYTVGMILRLTEGSMAPVACLDDDEDGVCERESECVSLRLWKMIDDAVSGVIDHVTLQDMLDWELEKSDFYVI